jgi:uncharacterized protein
VFKEMRRSDRQLEASEAEKILKKCEYGIFSSIDENDYPYGVPLSYVYLKGSLYFHSALQGKKLDNIKNSDKVSFTVVGAVELLPGKFTTNYESVVVFGKASEVQGEEKYEALVAILDKYAEDFMEKGIEYIKSDDSIVKVVKISIEHMTGKARR